MSVKSSFAALLLSWSNAINGTVKDNNQKENTPETVRQALTDLYDTLGISWFDVADIATLNSYNLGTNFKEWDIAFVADIGKGDKIGVYQYARSRATTLLGWKLLFELGESTKLITTAESTLSNYISNDWTTGDLAIGYLVKLTGGQTYVLVTGTGSSTGNYVQLTDVITALNYKGAWDADTNTPTLSDSGGGGVEGDYYIVSVAGTTTIDGVSDWGIGDWITNNGSIWQKIDNTDAVTSVNSQTGAVVLDIDDVTPTTTKGDIIVENGSNAIRLAVGSTNGDSLEVDSAEATGIKWVTKLTTTSVASSATPSPIGSSRENEYYLTSLAVGATFATPSGTPVNGNTLFIRIEDDGTARTLAWNAIYRAMSEALPVTTVLGKVLYIGFVYNSTDSKWDCIGINQEV